MYLKSSPPCKFRGGGYPLVIPKSPLINSENLIQIDMSNTNQFQSIADFAKANNITQIAKIVRINANKYSFLTFITDDNKAINVYFGSSIGNEYLEDMPVTREMLADLQIYHYVADDNTQRMRLVRKGETLRVSIADLL